MAATQVFSAQSYSYCVIDNVAAPSFPTLSDNTHIGYDTANVVADLGAAVAQGLNTKPNGTIPDAVNAATSIATGLIIVNLKYKNPA